MGIEQFIANEVKSNDVVLFMKGTPQFPMCGFSGQVVQILDYLGIAYKGLNVLDNDELRNGIKSFSALAPEAPASLRKSVKVIVANFKSYKAQIARAETVKELFDTSVTTSPAQGFHHDRATPAPASSTDSSVGQSDPVSATATI